MKVKLTLILFLFISCVAFAQWQPTNGPFSGEIHSVITSNNEIIVGTKYIYKSSDNGATWNVSNNGISGTVNYIYSLAKISTNIVAGTDAGVFYSTDNGDNWTLSAGTASIGVFCIVVKGTNLFMSTVGSGVYKSTTNGVTWSAVNNGITNITWMRAIVVKGTDLYAGTDGYGIYKSTNDGANWSLVNTGLPGSFYSVSALAVVGNNIIAGTYGAGVYKSTNNGGSWSAVNNGVSTTDNILCMGVNGTSIYASTILGNLYMTTDYTNWNAVSPGNFTATRFEAFYQDGAKFYTGGWGFGSPEQSYGLFVTSNNGTTWKQVGITDYPIAALEVTGSNILAGTNDISGNSFRIPLFKTTEADSVWHFNLGGFAGKNITAIKASGAIAYLFDDEGPGSSLVYRSTNNGNNWTSTGFNVLYNHFTSFVIAGSLVYAGDDQNGDVMVSSNNGQTWTAVTTGIPSSVLSVYSLVLKGTVLFAGTDNGVYKNTVSQNNWTAVSSGLTNMYIKSLYTVGNDLYAGTQGGGIFKSSNDGASWTSVSNGVPLFTNITCFAGSGSTIFAGTDNGVLSTYNAGTNWTSLNTGLIDTAITKLAVSTNYLWAGTFAHGVWRRQLSQIVTGINETNNEPSFSVSPNPATASIKIEIPGDLANSNEQLCIYNITGSLVLQEKISDNISNINISAFPKGVYFVTISSNTNIHTEKLIIE